MPEALEPEAPEPEARTRPPARRDRGDDLVVNHNSLRDFTSRPRPPVADRLASAHQTRAAQQLYVRALRERCRILIAHRHCP